MLGQELVITFSARTVMYDSRLIQLLEILPVFFIQLDVT